MDEGFKDRLKRLRLQQRLKQSELAEKAEMSTVHYGRYERGEVEPSPGILSQLALALCVTEEYLLTGEGFDESLLDDFRDQELFKQFKELEKLSNEDREIVKEMVGAFLFQRKVQKMSMGRGVNALPSL